MSKTLLKKLAIRIVVTGLLGFLLAFANWHWGTVTIDPPLDAARAQWQANPTDANRVALDQAQSFHNGIRNRLLLRWTFQGFVLVTIIWLVIGLCTWITGRVRMRARRTPDAWCSSVPPTRRTRPSHPPDKLP